MDLDVMNGGGNKNGGETNASKYKGCHSKRRNKSDLGCIKCSRVGR